METVHPATTALGFVGKLLLGLFGAAVLLFLLAFTSAAYLGPSDALEEADAIVVISGGGMERFERGIELFHAGWAPQIVFSGDASDPKSPSNAAAMAALAHARGLWGSQIRTDDTSTTTYQNAVNTRRLLPDARTIILVTSSYHQRRALRAFEEAFGPGTRIINAPASVAFFLPWNWWTHEDGRRLFFAEYGKLFYILFTGKHERA